MPTYVLYHANCRDGFGAAYAAWKYLGGSAVYLPVQYGKPIPPLESPDTVYIVDFHYSRREILELRERAEVIVMDHHATSREELVGLAGCYWTEDRSGAMMAWQYFHPMVPPPDVIRYVQDHDLWRFRLPYSKEYSAGLKAQPQDFLVWDRLNTDELIIEGGGALKVQESQISEVIKMTRMETIAGHTVPIVSSPVLQSEITERLCLLYPDAPFSVCYFDRADGFRQYRLTSVGAFNVGELAKSLGGGGHPKAAGFTLLAPSAGIVL